MPFIFKEKNSSLRESQNQMYVGAPQPVLHPASVSSCPLGRDDSRALCPCDVKLDQPLDLFFFFFV